MTITSEPSISHSDAALASRFALEAEPLFEVLSRGAKRLTRCDADAEDLLQDALLHHVAGLAWPAPATHRLGAHRRTARRVNRHTCTAPPSEKSAEEETTDVEKL